MNHDHWHDGILPHWHLSTYWALGAVIVIVGLILYKVITKRNKK